MLYLGDDEITSTDMFSYVLNFNISLTTSRTAKIEIYFVVESSISNKFCYKNFYDKIHYLQVICEKRYLVLLIINNFFLSEAESTGILNISCVMTKIQRIFPNFFFYFD